MNLLMKQLLIVVCIITSFHCAWAQQDDTKFEHTLRGSHLAGGTITLNNSFSNSSFGGGNNSSPNSSFSSSSFGANAQSQPQTLAGTDPNSQNPDASGDASAAQGLNQNYDASNTIGGNIIGVGSKINQRSFRWYQKAKVYRQFEFIWDPNTDTITGQPVGVVATPGAPAIGTPPNGQQPAFGSNPNGPFSNGAPPPQNPPPSMSDPNQQPPLQAPTN